MLAAAQRENLRRLQAFNAGPQPEVKGGLLPESPPSLSVIEACPTE